MDRREFTRLVVLVGSGLMLDEEAWDRLASALRRPSTIDQQAVDELEAHTVLLSRLERTAAHPQLLLHLVVSHLSTVTSLLDQGASAPLHRRLLSLAAEAGGLAGWLSWNLGDFVLARHYFTDALGAAREGGDKALGAYLIGGLAYQPLYRERPEQRLRLLDTSALAAASPHTRAWLQTMEAGAFALLGRMDDWKRSIASAQELLLKFDDPGRRRPRASFFNHIYLGEEMASGLLRLGKPRQAREALLSVLDGGYGLMALWLQVDLACAAAGEGEPELAARHALAALPGALAGGVEPVLENLRQLSGELAAHRDLPEVAELAEALVPT